MERFVVSEYTGSTLRRRLRADSAAVAPLRAGPLQIAAVRELNLTGVRLEQFVDEGGSPVAAGATPESGARGAIGIAAAGERIVGANFRKLEGTVVAGGEVLVRIAAERGSLDSGTGDVVLRDVTLDHVRAALTFKTARAVWRGDAIEVSGTYEVREGARVSTGRGLRVDLSGARRAR